MKNLLSIITAIVILCISLQAQGHKISGFGQVKSDKDGFTVPKVRVFMTGPVYLGLLNTQFHYELYVDLFFTPDTIGIEPGFASIVAKTDYLPVEFVFGQTLDPVTYQFPAPFMLPVLKYPKASMNSPLALGVFARYKSEKLWVMAGYVNGDDELGIDRDVTGRIEYKLPYGFSVDAIYRGGNDKTNNRREYYGGSLSFKSGAIWINGGRNHKDYIENKVAQWLWGTYDLNQYLQVVGLYESLEIADDKYNGWAAGINFLMSKKTVLRVSYQKRAEKKGFKGWGMILQQMF